MTTQDFDKPLQDTHRVEERLELPLARAELEPTLARARTNGIILVLINVLWIGLEAARQNVVWAFVLILALFVTAPRLLKAIRRLRSIRDDVIWVDEAHLWLPMIATDRDAVRVPIGDLCLIEQRWPDEVDAGSVRLGTDDLTVHLPADVLQDPSAIHVLSGLLINRVCQRPGGRERLVAGRELDGERRARFGRRPLATMVITTVVAVVHLAQLWTGAIGDSVMGGDAFQLIRMGANVPWLVLDGEYDRLVTATFMHGGWIHVMMNGVALLALGAIIENTVGRRRFIVIYGGSALAASYASTLWSGALVSVGASGAIFGLLGALAVVQLRHPDVLPPRLRQSRRWWIIILLLNGALPLLVPQIDYIAHGVGFVVGALCAVLVAPRESLANVGQAVPLWTTVAAGMFCAVTIAAIGVRGAHYPSGEDIGPAFMTSAPVKTPRQREALNAMAWTMAIEAEVSQARLLAARGMMERVIDQDRNAAFRDTLATLCFRTGQQATAAEIERGVLVERDERFMASQVLRFLLGVSRAVQPLAEIERGEQDTVRVKLPRDPSGREIAFWGVFKGEQPHGLLRVTGGAPEGADFKVAGDSLGKSPVSFYYLGRYPPLDGEETPPARFWRYDPEVDTLPPRFRRPRP